MKVELRKWCLADKKELKDLCNAVDRSYLSDRLPNPYTEDDANWWLNMVTKSEGIDGTFRAMVVDGKIVGSVSIERKADIYRLDGELGYMLLRVRLQLRNLVSIELLQMSFIPIWHLSVFYKRMVLNKKVSCAKL